MQQVPESEIVYITFNKDWLKQNGVNPDSSGVKLTFPTTWVRYSEATHFNDNTVELSVPKKLLMDHNESKSPYEITVTFPESYFKGLPTPIEPPAEVSNKSLGGVVPLDVIYQQRIWYNHTSGANILGASGKILAYYHNNPSAESFQANQEIEYYASTGNDAIEVVIEYNTSSSNTKVCFAIWNNGSMSLANYRNVSIGSTTLYEWYIGGTTYYLWFKIGSSWYYGSFSDSTIPTDFYYFTGSSEFDTIGGLNGHLVNVITYPITIEGLMTTSWQGASYVNTRLQLYSTDSAVAYVDISSIKDSNGLRFYEYGGSSY